MESECGGHMSIYFSVLVPLLFLRSRLFVGLLIRKHIVQSPEATIANKYTWWACLCTYNPERAHLNYHITATRILALRWTSDQAASRYNCRVRTGSARERYALPVVGLVRTVICPIHLYRPSCSYQIFCSCLLSYPY